MMTTRLEFVLKNQEHKYSRLEVVYVGLIPNILLFKYIMTKDLGQVLGIVVNIIFLLRPKLTNKVSFLIFLEMGSMILGRKFLKFLE